MMIIETMKYGVKVMIKKSNFYLQYVYNNQMGKNQIKWKRMKSFGSYLIGVAL